MKSLSRLEINRVRGTGSTFTRFMAARRFKGGIHNVAAVRLFLLWLDNGRQLPIQQDIPMPVGDLSRHDSERCLDIAGMVSDEAINASGKFHDEETYTFGWTPEDREAQRIAKARAEESVAKAAAAKRVKAKKSWEGRQARKAKRAAV